MSGRIILFTHQSKTAGMSLYEVFKANIGSDKIIGDGIERDFFYSLSKLQQGTVECISGHLAFGLHNFVKMPGKTPVYVTILRDPVMRHASEFYYRRGLGEPYDQVANLREWMRSPLRTKNTLLLHLCHYDDNIDADRAFKRLSDDYAAFGITEHLPESVYMICKALGFEKVFVPWENKGKRPSEKMDEAEYNEYREIMLREDALEMQVYERAKSLFLERLAALSASDHAAIEALKAAPMAAAPKIAAVQTDPVADRVETLVQHLSTLERTLIEQISSAQDRLEAVIEARTDSIGHRIDDAARLSMRAEERVDAITTDFTVYNLEMRLRSLLRRLRL